MNLYNTPAAAEYVGVRTVTLRKYAKEGSFVPLVNATGKKYYTEEMLNDFLEGTYNPEDTDKYLNFTGRAIEIKVDLTKMSRVVSLSDSEASYYSLPEETKRELNCSHLEVLKKDGHKTYSIGRIIKDGEKYVFNNSFSWRG